MVDFAQLTTVSANTVGRDDARRLMMFTRAAYAGSDPLPGLPTPDGAVEGAGELMRFLGSGGSLRMLGTGDDIVALARTTVLPDGAMWVSRVAVAPQSRGRSIGARLMARLEESARAEGHRVVRLDAVIERCLLPYYAALGYRVTAYHLPDDGKPLTEAGMERDLTQPRTPLPPAGPDPGATRVLAWYASAATTTAVVRAGSTDPAAHEGPGFVGLDAWLGDPDQLLDLLHTRPGARPTHDPCVVTFPARRADVPLHVRPRTVHGDLWALLRHRPPAGNERTTHPIPITASRSDTCP